jgi:hypothetical protein
MTIRQVNKMGAPRGRCCCAVAAARSRCACLGSGLMNHQEGVLVTMELATCDMEMCLLQPRCDFISVYGAFKPMVGFKSVGIDRDLGCLGRR